ncbi:MAG: rRNA pseudouridine synthase [Clostridiales bacterium]|nr:rRNA pseudouridine synthase [Clostridiales bacterium]
MEKVRLQKIISQSGVCSRRKAEEYIKRGKVTVNGHPANIGDKADPINDIIAISGRRVQVDKKQPLYYIMMNKPRGYVTTMSDEFDRRTVVDLLEGLDERVYPIGRLDRNSEGLLLFTNDGEFANDIMHPSRKVSKTYRVTIPSNVTEEQLVKLSTGVVIDGRETTPLLVNVLSESANRTVLQIVINEGRNRQVRKMCLAAGMEVARLKRTNIGPLKLGMLKPGTYRELTKEELRAIRNAITKEK